MKKLLLLSLILLSGCNKAENNFNEYCLKANTKQECECMYSVAQNVIGEKKVYNSLHTGISSFKGLIASLSDKELTRLNMGLMACEE